MEVGLTAYLFPGQSPQKPGLGRDLCRRYPRAREIFDAADDHLGFALSRLCFEGPEDRLNQDLNCQLAVYTHSCALSAILEANGRRPDLVSGYSSGFYAAAFAAGCFEFVHGLAIVRRAGELLLDQAAKVEGGMGVVFGLAPDEVAALCRETGDVQPAIFNTPRQMIISGRKGAVESTLEKASEAGALDAYLLPAAAAYHSTLMTPAAEQLPAAVDPAAVRAPRIPLISYTSLEPVKDAQNLVEVMAVQLSRPVRWVELVQGLRPAGVQRAFDVGPGRVIARSVRWIDRHLEMLAVDGVEGLEALI